MRYYPLFLDIAGRKCVVVGGGSVAERKVERLLACGASVEVVGKVIAPFLAALGREGKIVCRKADYNKFCLTDAFLAIGATDDAEANRQIANDAKELGIPINIADDTDLCDFILPSVLERGDLCIAVSTAGRSPALAKKIRIELEGAYGDEYRILLNILGDLRGMIISRRHSSDENRDLFEAVVSLEMLDHIRAGRWEAARELILQRTGIDMEVKPR